MNRIKIIITSIIISAILLLTIGNKNSIIASNNSNMTSNTLVFTNAFVYTVNPNQPTAEAVAVRNGKILAVGTEQQVLATAGNDPQIINLQGKMLMPGFQDSHVHAVEAGINAENCVLPRSASFAQYRQSIQACAAQQTGQTWVLAAGVGMEPLLNRSTGSTLPIDVLDQAVPNRPVLILDDLGHGAWTNTLGMQAVGYDTRQGNPAGGVIDVDSASGRKTGVVFENAQQKLRDAALPPTQANIDFAYQSLLGSLTELNKNGITSVSDAGGFWGQGHHQAWIEVENENRLTVRASNALYVYPDRPFAQQIADMTAIYSNDPNRLLRFNHAKLYIDGILDQGTSALNAPYNSEIGISGQFPMGFQYFDTPTFNQYVQTLDDAGFQLHFHATGDRGVNLTLNAIENAKMQNGNNNRRHRITHSYLIGSNDLPRFNQLGVVGDFQLAPFSISSTYREEIRPFIGNRADRLLPAGSLINAGAKVILSSDWDADELSPFRKLSAVLARNPEGIPNVATAIRMMTLDTAFALQQDTTTGSIEVGKMADLIVLDRNITQIPINQIQQTKVKLTMLGGKVVYSDGITVKNPTSNTDFDFDGDSRTDISIFRPSLGEWWYLRSSDNNNRALQFGSSDDIPTPSDFTGDGITDIAFFRPNSGEWFILRSEDNSFFSFPFGTNGDIPAPADFDGDGKADVAVYRPNVATWFIQKSTGGTDIIGFGVAEDKPVVADYDGDGKADIAVYRPSVSEWWINRSNDGIIAYQFGTNGDKTVQGDYTGDGKADVAIWRESTGEWFILRSEDASFYAFPFGTNGDIPTPGDYDGDGKFDTAVFRPTNNTWFINNSTSGVQIVGFGANGDVPIPNVYSRN